MTRHLATYMSADTTLSHELKQWQHHTHLGRQQHVHRLPVVDKSGLLLQTKPAIVETWQDGEEDDDDDVEEQDVADAHPNGHPAPPVVGGHANGGKDAIP